MLQHGDGTRSRECGVGFERFAVDMIRYLCYCMYNYICVNLLRLSARWAVHFLTACYLKCVLMAPLVLGSPVAKFLSLFTLRTAVGLCPCTLSFTLVTSFLLLSTSHMGQLQL